MHPMPDTPITGTIAHEHAHLFTEPDPTRMAEWMQAHVKRRSVDVKGADFIRPLTNAVLHPVTKTTIL